MAEDSSSSLTFADPLASDDDVISESVNLVRFEITGLFGRPLNHTIEFPSSTTRDNEPNLLILMGPNGCGKTTILRMIDGMRQLDFDAFRQVPFTECKLTLSDGHELSVRRLADKELPLLVSFGDCVATLSRTKSGYTAEQSDLIAKFRKLATPIMNGIRFRLIDIHRSLALRDPRHDGRDNSEVVYYARGGRVERAERRQEQSRELSRKVLEFVREAQVDYRKFFVADQLELLPKILSSLTHQVAAQESDLATRVSTLKSRSPIMARIGLQTDDPDLDTLADLLKPDSQYKDKASLAVLATYVATQETRAQTRELIAKRLLSFEELMDDFLVGKTVRVDPRRGLRIETLSTGGILEETELSSGEYHFLYMMVTALLSHRTSSVIAIDEPELSLHVKWQRRIITALTRCASGASPLFLFATHSAAIAAEHAERVRVLAVEE